MFTSLIRRAPAALSMASCRAVRALVVCALLPLRATHPPATSLDRPVSHALSADIATPLRDALARRKPRMAVGLPVADGATALQMRIALARAATKTLDMQYYIATEDTTGKLLLAAALYAADRGVRADAGRRSELPRYRSRDGRAQHAPEHRDPRVQPFGASQRGMVERTANFFTRIDSFTRRMHNKAMIADNQPAIVGGRNSATNTSVRFPTLQFRDLDVLAAGPVTSDISKSFDDYWASASSYPLRVLNQQTFDPKDLDAMRDELRDHWRKNADPYNAKLLNATPLARQIARDELELVWALPNSRSMRRTRSRGRPARTWFPPMQRLPS